MSSTWKSSYLSKENQDDSNSLTIPLVFEKTSTPKRQCSFARSVINGMTNLFYN